jgi:hypothetical protein
VRCLDSRVWKASQSRSPLFFISHAATDEPIVRVLHDELNRIFAKGVDVFATSVPGVVQPGTEWLDSINENLEKASAVIVLLTPVSLNRPFIWFEVGASWSRARQNEGVILPVCVPEVDKGSLPEPLSRLQALSLDKAVETKLLFQTLADLFGFGNLKGFRASTIKAKLPKYATLPVAESDLRAGAVYRGPFEGYTDDELREVIVENMLNKAWKDRWGEFVSDHFRGGLIHFRQVDDKLELPPGTAKRLLPQLATDRYYVMITQHMANTIRFIVDDAAYESARGRP